MGRQISSAVHRLFLPPGTRVDEWVLRSYHGHGAFGVVYRAVRVGQESAGEVALKMALVPWEPRFMRELGLLSLVRHPSVPRLLGHGVWALWPPSVRRGAPRGAPRTALRCRALAAERLLSWR
jgi:hypothetical protein